MIIMDDELKEKIKVLQSQIENICYCDMWKVPEVSTFNHYVPIKLRNGGKKTIIATREVCFCPQCGRSLGEAIWKEDGSLLR